MEIPLERWIPFFSLVGGAAATLAGLLFVALSINRDKLSAGESKIMLRLAQRCFADYLFVLVICVFLLIPSQGNVFVAAELGFLGTRRCFRLLRHARDSTHDRARHLLEWQTMQDYALPVISAVSLVFVSGLFYLNVKIAPYLVVPIVTALVASASWSAWLLLVMEKDFAKRA